MAIGSSGMYGLTLEKMFIDTSGQSLEAETHNGMLLLDSYTPAFDTHDFRADIDASEVTGTTNYTAGGQNLTTTEVTVGSVAAGIVAWDFDNPAWASSTIPNAMALACYFDTGNTATDQLILLLDFVTAVSSTNGTLTVQIHANGALNVDCIP